MLTKENISLKQRVESAEEKLNALQKVNEVSWRKFHTAKNLDIIWQIDLLRRLYIIEYRQKKSGMMNHSGYCF